MVDEEPEISDGQMHFSEFSSKIFGMLKLRYCADDTIWEDGRIPNAAKLAEDSPFLSIIREIVRNTIILILKNLIRVSKVYSSE